MNNIKIRSLSAAKASAPGQGETHYSYKAKKQVAANGNRAYRRGFKKAEKTLRTKGLIP